MYIVTSFFSSHFTGSHRSRPLCPFIPLFLVLMLFVAMPLEAQAAVPDAVARVNELHAMAPTVEDLLRQGEGRWSLKRGVGNSVFFAADGLHVRSRTTDTNKPYLMMTQSDLVADALLVEVEAQHVKGALFNGFGFYLMHAPGDYTFFYISNNGYASIQHVTSTGQEILVPWQGSSAIQTQSHATNQLGLLVEEGHATLFVNDSEVATVDGLALEGATLGLVATSYEEAIVEIAFRDLRYWNLDDLSTAPCAAQEQPTDDITAQLAAAALTLDDLHEGFEAVPEDDVQTWLEDSILDMLEGDGSVDVMNRFGFFHPDRYSVVIGASGSISNSIDGLITYMTTIVKREPTVEIVELEQVGDESVAFVLTTVEEEESVSLEFLLFRRDQLLALLMVGYLDDTEPVITMGELAELWDARLANLPEGELDKVNALNCLKEGKASLDQAKWQQALEALTQAIELDPKNVEAYYYRGLAHYQLGTEDPDHYGMAIEDLTQAMESEDFFDEASTARNKINQVVGADDLLAIYSEQIENSEHPAAVYAGRGIVYRDQLGDYEMAIADLTQAIELATVYRRGDYYVDRAFAHMENSNAEATIEDATQAIEDQHTTRICSAYAYRGSQYAQLGEYEEAEADLEHARINCSDDAADLAFVSHQLGIVRYYQGDLEAALALFSDAIDNNAEAARSAAWESWESNFASEPEENFEAIITYFETLVTEHQLQAWRERKLGSDYEKYLSVLKAYDEEYAWAARTYSLRGSVYRDQAEYDLAIEAYTMAIDIDPLDNALPNWYALRGGISYDQGDFDAARDDLTAAITLGRPNAPEMAIAYNLLGLIASEEGNHQEALAHYNMAISIKPDNAVIYYNRALTLYDLDDYESAIADLKMVLELSEDAELRAEAEEALSLLE